MTFRKPIQKRAEISTQRFLSALDELLREKSFNDLSVVEIAERSCQTKSAFLKRFGTKEQSLFVLFSVYADEVSASMARFTKEFDEAKSLPELFFGMSFHFERMLLKHFSANRAMNENFNTNLQNHPITERIFSECVTMMQVIQQRVVKQGYSDAGARSAAQLLVSLNFHYTLKAMPALPEDTTARHSLVAEILSVAVKK